MNPLRVLWHLKTEVVSASLIDLPMFYFVLFLLACSQARTETAAVATVTQQAEDSVARAVIPPEGGTVALAGFATVIFPPQAFDAPREVTVEATTLPTTRRIIHLSMLLARSAPALGHEIRVTTGASPPAREIDVCVNVPAEYVSGLPSDHTVALYAQEVTGGPEESIERFRRFPSEFDVQAGAVRAQLPARVFDDLQRLPGRFEAVVAIGSQPSR